MNTTATRELVGLQTREFVRDSKHFYFALIFPLGMMAMFLGIAELTPDTPGAEMGFGETVVPMTIFLSVTSVTFLATAAPLAAMRAKGTLRLLGTTPVGRTRMILTHIPARLGLVLFQVTALLCVGVAMDLVEPGTLPALFGTTLLGLLMFGALGYLMGGILPSAESAANVSTAVQLAALFLSGLVLPLSMLPDTAESLLSYLPTTFFADLLIHQMPQGEPTHPVWLSVAVILATAAVLTALAVRTFRWDQGDND